MGKVPTTPIPQGFLLRKSAVYIFFSFWVDHQRVCEFPLSPWPTLGGVFFLFFCFVLFFFLVDTNLLVSKFWVIIFFSHFYRRVRLRSMLDFPYTRLHDIISFLTLTILWQSSASFWSVRSGSFSNFDETLRLISASFADTRPCANIRHLKLSADNSPSLKS